MDELVDSLSDKDNINMYCLSVEWANLYCAFNIYEGYISHLWSNY